MCPFMLPGSSKLTHGIVDVCEDNRTSLFWANQPHLQWPACAGGLSGIAVLQWLLCNCCHLGTLLAEHAIFQSDSKVNQIKLQRGVV